MNKLTEYLYLAVSDIDIRPIKNGGAAAGQSQLNDIVNIIFGIAGSLAFLFIIIGGLRFVMSEGDPSKASQAKSTIVYALIGLVITLTGYGIVRFVAGQL